MSERTATELTVSAIRGEYARFLDHHDTFELARAVGQIIDMLPESERRIVERPGEEDE